MMYLRRTCVENKTYSPEKGKKGRRRTQTAEWRYLNFLQDSVGL